MGAGLEGEERRGRYRRGVFGAFPAPSGTFAYLARQAGLARSAALRGGAGGCPIGGAGAGAGASSRASRWPRRKGLFLQPPLGWAAGGEVRVSGRQTGSRPKPGSLLLCGPPLFSFPLRPRLRRFRSAAGAGPRRGRGWSGLRQAGGEGGLSYPGPAHDCLKTKKARRGYRRSTPWNPGPRFSCRAARSPAPVFAPAPSSRSKLCLTSFPIRLWFCHFC